MTTHKLIDPKEAIAIINREFGLCIDIAKSSVKSVSIVIDHEGVKASAEYFCRAPIGNPSEEADEK